jgi:hypothetical protein
MCGCTQTISSFDGRKPSLNSAVGMIPSVSGFSNLEGDTTTVTTTSTPTTTEATTGTKITNTMDSILSWGTQAANIYKTVTGTSSTTPRTTVVVAPAEEKKVPLAVWLVAGALVLIFIAFVVSRLAKK